MHGGYLAVMLSTWRETGCLGDPSGKGTILWREKGTVELQVHE
jgi:hypothetical protein